MERRLLVAGVKEDIGSWWKGSYAAEDEHTGHIRKMMCVCRMLPSWHQNYETNTATGD